MNNPIHDYTESGLNDFMQHTENKSAITQSEIKADEVENFLDSIIIEEKIVITHTTVLAVDHYYIDTTVLYRNQQKAAAAYGIAFLVSGSGVNKTLKPLPFYKMDTTKDATFDTFLMSEVHKVFFDSKSLLIASLTNAANTYTFEAYVFKDKSDNKR